MKLAIIGEKKSVLAFRALGVESFGVVSREELLSVKEKIVREDLAVVFVTEDVASKYPQEIEGLCKETLPAVLIVPGISSAGLQGREGLKKILERALGSQAIELN